MTMTVDKAAEWLEALKTSWEASDVDGALSLFSHTIAYYERPFKPGTSQAEIATYWRDIVGLCDITFDYEIVAIEGNRVIVHWRNGFRVDGDSSLLDGVFFVDFDDAGNCVEFRQWWFSED